jgi:small-conductance mechanosensitive channel
MSAIVPYLRSNWMDLIVPLAVLAITLAAGWVTKRVLFTVLDRWAKRTVSRADDVVLDSIRGPFMIWVLMLGLHLATRVSVLPRNIASLVSQLLLILWIVSLTIAASRLATRLVRIYGSHLSNALPVTSLTQNLARMAVASIGVLVLLSNLGVSVTPILTALGVGGLAVALALQDTLANFFAGFYISVANQVRLGDYIKLDSGEEGYVTDITWRSTTIRMLANNLVIVPNLKLAQAIVTNYHLPEKRMSLQVPVSVSYDSDPEVVERVLIEEALSAAGEVPGLLAEPAPFVRFIPGFGESSLNFTLICQVREFVDQYLAQHELRKRIFTRFRKMGIEIPFPIRTVYLRGQQTDGGNKIKVSVAGND